MPKLRRRIRVGGPNLTLPTNISCNITATTNNALIINNNNLSTDTSGVSQASSSQSVQQDDRPIMGKQQIWTDISLSLLLVNGNDDVGNCNFFFTLCGSTKLAVNDKQK